MTTLTHSLGHAGYAAPRPNLRRVLGWLFAFDALFRERRHIAELDDRMLRDIGVTRGDIAETLRQPDAHLRLIRLRSLH